MYVCTLFYNKWNLPKIQKRVGVIFNLQVLWLIKLSKLKVLVARMVIN